MAELTSGEVEAIINRHGREASKLIPILQEVQRARGHLAETAMQQIADALEIPLSKVYAVATFYSLFATSPKGKHVVRLCESAPCHVRGAKGILDALRKELSVAPGETTTDGLFTLEHTSCLGACDTAPAMMVDDVVYGSLTPAKIKEVVASYRRAAAAAGQ